MKVQKYRSFEVVGTTLPDIEVEAVQLTRANIDQVARWCSGTAYEGSRALSVPVSVMVGDPNRHHPLGRGLEKRIQRARAPLGSYIVKWGDDFFVVTPDAFENTYRPLA